MLDAVLLGPAEAREQGVNFYELPEKLKPEMVDEEIRTAVWRINESGWIWTAESCAGHWGGEGWAGNVRPMLRLVCRKADLGELLRHLYDSVLYQGEDRQIGAVGFTVWHYPRTYADFHELIVYIEARTDEERGRGLDAWRQFSERIQRDDYSQMIADGVDVAYVGWLRQTTDMGGKAT